MGVLDNVLPNKHRGGLISSEEQSEEIKLSHSSQVAKLLKLSRLRHEETILFLL